MSLNLAHLSRKLQWSYCDRSSSVDVVVVGVFVAIRSKLLLTTYSLKPLDRFLSNLAESISGLSSFKGARKILASAEPWLPWQQKLGNTKDL